MKKIYKAGSFLSYIWEKISALVAPSGNHTKVGDTTIVNVFNINFGGSRGNSPPSITINGRLEEVKDSKYISNKID